MFDCVFAGIGRIVVTIDGGWPELELLCQDNSTRFTAEHRQGSCRASCCLARTQPQKCAALASFIVALGPDVIGVDQTDMLCPWSRRDDGWIEYKRTGFIHQSSHLAAMQCLWMYFAFSDMQNMSKNPCNNFVTILLIADWEWSDAGYYTQLFTVISLYSFASFHDKSRRYYQCPRYKLLGKFSQQLHFVKI